MLRVLRNQHPEVVSTEAPVSYVPRICEWMEEGSLIGICVTEGVDVVHERLLCT